MYITYNYNDNDIGFLATVDLGFAVLNDADIITLGNSLKALPSFADVFQSGNPINLASVTKTVTTPVPEPE